MTIIIVIIMTYTWRHKGPSHRARCCRSQTLSPPRVCTSAATEERDRGVMTSL